MKFNHLCKTLTADNVNMIYNLNYTFLYGSADFFCPFCASYRAII